jgi:molybdopterin molybdotransferase
VIDFDEACRRTAQLARPLRRESIPLARAAGRRLAAPVVAGRTAPAADTSAMDGYAVCSADLDHGAAALRIVARAFAGDASGGAPLAAGECARVFTGAPIPRGADRVVIQEVVRREGDVALFPEPPCTSRHVRRAGSDFRRGEVLLDRSVLLTPQAMVAAAAADLTTLDVFARPRVAILSTGDELAEPGAAGLRQGAIPDSVSFGVAALSDVWGAQVVGRRRVRDELDCLVAAAREALDLADVVVVTGGASVGERDHAKAMFEPHGLEAVFERVAIKPGKPIWLGRAGRSIVVGLPGNPSAAMVTARLFLAPLLAGLAGAPPQDALAWRLTPLAAPLPQAGDRECFLRGRGEPTGVVPLTDQDSSGQKALAAADLLIRRRPGARALAPGDFAEVLTF